MRYFAEFNEQGERITTYIADGMPYTVSDILEKFPNAIEITEQEQQKYMLGYIRGKKGHITKQEEIEEDIESIRQRKIKEVKNKALNRLLETDHLIVEQYELNNLSEEDYNQLKKNVKKYVIIEIVCWKKIYNSNNKLVIKNIKFLL